MGNELTPWEGYLTPEKTEPVKNGDTSAFIAPEEWKNDMLSARDKLINMIKEEQS